MIWRFSLIDRNNVQTIIDEPVGWDAAQLVISRDPDYHGVFFGNQGTGADGNDYEFYKKAYQLLKTEYDNYGFQGYMLLLTEQSCDTDTFIEVDRSQFDFNNYAEDCSASGCFVKIPAEIASGIMTLRNLINQAVDLGATLAFDQSTVLAPYTRLPFVMSLPSKGILLQDTATNVGVNSTDLDGGLQDSDGSVGATHYNLTYEQLELGFNTPGSSELGSFSLSENPLLTAILQNNGSSGETGDGFFYPSDLIPTSAIYPLDASPVLNYSSDSLNFGQITNPVQLSYSIKAVLNIKNTYLERCCFYIFRLPDRPNNNANGTLPDDYELIKQSQYLPASWIGTQGPLPDYPDTGAIFLYPGGSIIIDEELSENIILNAGDRFYCFITIQEKKTQAQIDAGLAGGNPGFNFTMNDGSFFKITNLSVLQPSDCKVFAINESISRVVESITNDQMRVYSDYFGRTDAQPYTSPVDGNGSLEVITNGLRIRRQENMTPGVTNIYSVSLQDLFNGLNPIHNIGLGLEDDPARLGKTRVRIETWDFFYTTDVIMRCVGINKIVKKAYEKEAYSTFSFGFQTWEAEQYTGLDEFLTKRVYRTTLTQVSNDYSQISAMIASGYALEVTRRLSNTTTSDWRYDNNTFIICCKRNNSPGSTTTTDYNIIVGLNFNSFTKKIIFPLIDGGYPFLVVGNTIEISGTRGNDGVYTIATVIDSHTIITVESIRFIQLSGATVTSSITIVIPPITSNELIVELGNVTDPENLLSPDTLYNYRISPVRNALRWMNNIFESYKKLVPDAKIIFTDGDGNYFAKGEMTSPVGRFENAPIGESDQIDVTVYADQSKPAPFKTPERITFTYPMSGQDYKNVMAATKGLIYYECGTIKGYGWIDTITYTPEQGTADFSLIPQIN